MSASNPSSSLTVAMQSNCRESRQGESRLATKEMADLPPEILTMLLEYLLADKRNNVLRYRLVNSQWKGIIDTHLERKILSGILQPFPEMGIGEGEPVSNLYIRSPLEILRHEGNVFPCNSLVLKGKYVPNAPDFPYSQKILMALPYFSSTFGGRLASLALNNQDFDPIIWTTMLGALPSLKFLILSDVRLNIDFEKSPIKLATPPALPNLTALKLGLRHEKEQNILDLWLIVSYADQLVRLNYKSKYILPALQQNRKYYCVVNGNQQVYVGTTSAIAFRKLLELKISHPSRQFLKQSITPALQNLSVVVVSIPFLESPTFDLQDLTSFLDNCRDTLEQLWLYIQWNTLLGTGPLATSLKMGLTSLPTAKITLPKLHTLALHNPKKEERIFLKNIFLVKCPALQKLHLFFFGLEPGAVGANVNVHKTTVMLRMKDFKQQFLGIHMMMGLDGGVNLGSALSLMIHPQPNLASAFDEDTFRRFRTGFLRSTLAAPGELDVRELVQQQRIWNICPELKTISVNVGEKAEGDVYVLRRGR
ncbi:unnamed protein product [Orchesella dallaii]|uniref:F-box domain-containing protein n=1 Tax=Orchesella dallaii TaxID=48710 RepID=A0ABP1S0Y9_9HEXA